MPAVDTSVSARHAARRDGARQRGEVERPDAAALLDDVPRGHRGRRARRTAVPAATYAMPIPRPTPAAASPPAGFAAAIGVERPSWYSR